ncbi:unnamed protein product [Onchocerca flexuosa]|uniref:Secreted protein n=1 Tax=Onchocerca flexuosa TaxID=387005 RepID=A0A183HHY3_9BILA|nr:unnamed protein product [Onchocerca flexuosa]
MLLFACLLFFGETGGRVSTQINENAEGFDIKQREVMVCVLTHNKEDKGRKGTRGQCQRGAKQATRRGEARGTLTIEPPSSRREETRQDETRT